MDTYLSSRNLMVETQLRPNNIVDPNILEAFKNIPREVFVMQNTHKSLAYMDTHLRTEDNRYLLAPLLIAKILQAAEIKSGDAVLIIGGSGYMAALAGYLGATVFVLDNNSEYASRTSKTLTQIEEDSVIFVEGDMTKGWPNEAPYDLILFAGAISYLEKELADQMDNGGRIIAPINQSDGKSGRVELWEKWHHHISSRILFEACTPFLPNFMPAEKFEF